MYLGQWSWKTLLASSVNYTVLLLYAIICCYPLYYIFIYSISDSALAGAGLTLAPVAVTGRNYERVLQLPGIGRAALISIARTVIQTGLMVFCSGFLGYLLTCQEMPLRRLVYRFFILTMYFSGGLIAVYLLMRRIGLYNNFFVYIVPGIVAVFNVILVKTFIEQMPTALEDSAKIDGANYLTIFVRIIFPLSLPILATIAVFGAVGQWNSWWDNLLYVPERKLRTLQFLLWEFLQTASSISTADITALIMEDQRKQISPRSIQMTVTMVVTLPVLFVYPYMQRYFVKGLMIGAIKA